MKIDSWIVRNLIEYRNVLISNEIMNKHSSEEVEKELSKLSGMPVMVFSKHVPKYDDMAMATMGNKVKLRTEKEQWWFAKIKES